MSSLYSQYILERTDRKILETEYGFATFTFTDLKTVYIEDIFVLPEFRKQGMASRFANEIKDIAKEKGCTKMIGTVMLTAKTATESLKTLLAYGMRLDSCNQGFLVLSKEI